MFSKGVACCIPTKCKKGENFRALRSHLDPSKCVLPQGQDLNRFSKCKVLPPYRMEILQWDCNYLQGGVSTNFLLFFYKVNSMQNQGFPCGDQFFPQGS